MGFISSYETPAGRRYKVRYRKPDHSEGAKRGFTSKREAKLWLASVEVDVSRNSYVDPARARITVDTWMTTWLGTRSDLRPTTRERVRGIIDRDVVPALGRYPLGDLSHSRCQEWLHGLSKRLGPASVRKCAAVLSGALEAAVRDGRLTANPARGLHLPRVSTRSKRYLTVAQVHDLAEVVDGIGAGKQNGAANGYGTLIRVLAFCGLRWGEVSGLRVGDVNFLRGRLEIQHTVVESGGVQIESTPKDYEARSVPVPKSILDELAVLVAGRRADEPVFRGSRSGSWVRGKVFRRGWLDKAAVLIGEPGLTPHELRHTAASIAVSLGANVKAVQRMLGHASAAVTLDVYADLFDADTDALSAALDRVASRPIASISRPRVVEGGK